MFRSKFIVIPVAVLAILSLAACKAAGMPAGAGASGQPPAGSLETQTAAGLASTAAAQIAPTSTQAATPTFTPTAAPTTAPVFTSTPTLAPTAAFTSAPGVPMVSVSAATNCRSGPTTVYDLLGILYVGQTASVVGRSIYPDTMIIQLPLNPVVTCWLWAQNAKVTGDISSLPLVNLPPTPTLGPAEVTAFAVSYASTLNCSGKYRFVFTITNTGSTAWESDSVKATDQITSESHGASYDDFPNWNSSCTEVSAPASLAPGGSAATISGAFSANPAGHSLKATIHVCSLDGMDGTCLLTTITFTP